MCQHTITTYRCTSLHTSHKHLTVAPCSAYTAALHAYNALHPTIRERTRVPICRTIHARTQRQNHLCQPCIDAYFAAAVEAEVDREMVQAPPPLQCPQPLARRKRVPVVRRSEDAHIPPRGGSRGQAGGVQSMREERQVTSGKPVPVRNDASANKPQPPPRLSERRRVPACIKASANAPRPPPLLSERRPVPMGVRSPRPAAAPAPPPKAEVEVDSEEDEQERWRRTVQERREAVKRSVEKRVSERREEVRVSERREREGERRREKKGKKRGICVVM